MSVRGNNLLFQNQAVLHFAESEILSFYIANSKNAEIIQIQQNLGISNFWLY